MFKRKKIYYFDSEIQKGLYTNGNEFMTYDNKEYIGPYHTYTVTGEIYTGDSFVQGKSQPLKRLLRELSNNTIKQYLETEPDLKRVGSITRLNRKKMYQPGTFINPISHYPKIEESDYDKGYIDRYFIKKRNDRGRNITEINKTTYDAISPSGPIDGNLYARYTLRWKISGPVRDQKNQMGIVDKFGIEDTNKRIIKTASREFKGIENYLTDYLEFARIK